MLLKQVRHALKPCGRLGSSPPRCLMESLSELVENTSSELQQMQQCWQIGIETQDADCLATVISSLCLHAAVTLPELGKLCMWEADSVRRARHCLERRHARTKEAA